MFLSGREYGVIKSIIEKEGGNKNVNWIRPIKKISDDEIMVEVGYWEQLVDCKPRYRKHIRVFEIT